MRTVAAAIAAIAFSVSPAAGPAGRFREGALLPLEDALPKDGRPVVLAFFATGCPPCSDDLLETAAFIRRNGLDIAVVGISADSEEEILAFIEKHSLAFPVVRDVRGRLRRRFRVGLLPMKVVLAGEREVHRDDDRLPLDERRRRADRCLRELAGRWRSGSRS